MEAVMNKAVTNVQPQVLAIMNQKLEDFVRDDLTPTPAYMEQGRVHYNKIFEYLKAIDKFKIGRTIVAGSIGKGTALGDKFKPDFDLVVFLNDQKPPFKDFIKTVHNMLQADGCITNLRSNDFSIQFNICDYEFDLLPAVNFTVDTIKSHDEQRRLAMKAIADNANPSGKRGGSLFSTSLAEFTVEFTKGETESPVVKKVIRLAKYWNKSVPIDPKVRIPGRSVMMELVAIYANRNQENDILTGFKRFLAVMSELDNVEIIFKTFYSEDEVPKSGSTPDIRDPTNPFCNIAHELGNKDQMKNVVKTFMKRAEYVLRNLNSLDVKTVQQCIEA